VEKAIKLGTALVVLALGIGTGLAATASSAIPAKQLESQPAR